MDLAFVSKFRKFNILNQHMKSSICMFCFSTLSIGGCYPSRSGFSVIHKHKLSTSWASMPLSFSTYHPSLSQPHFCYLLASHQKMTSLRNFGFFFKTQSIACLSSLGL